ncbi:hypothetical protein BGX38DRAFT_1263453 [Terfezia claveryi]|nr:hypothetical protein BGX38DRAFT_1263453 [Terfezia claveryi]
MALPSNMNPPPRLSSAHKTLSNNTLVEGIATWYFSQRIATAWDFLSFRALVKANSATQITETMIEQHWAQELEKKRIGGSEVEIEHANSLLRSRKRRRGYHHYSTIPLHVQTILYLSFGARAHSEKLSLGAGARARFEGNVIYLLWFWSSRPLRRETSPSFLSPGARARSKGAPKTINSPSVYTPSSIASSDTEADRDTTEPNGDVDEILRSLNQRSGGASIELPSGRDLQECINKALREHSLTPEYYVNLTKN